MKALTIWQPWASLIMIGAKPVEFRSWDYSATRMYRDLVGKRIVIHAGGRSIKPAEIDDLLARCKSDDRPSLIVEKALPLLERIRAAWKCQGVVELSAGLGTVVIGKPKRVDALFKKPDSDRLYQHMYGWPLSDIQQWPEPMKIGGSQGFWDWPSVPRQVRKAG